MPGWDTSSSERQEGDEATLTVSKGLASLLRGIGKLENVDCKKVPALQGLDLSAWRGKSREEVRVTTA